MPQADRVDVSIIMIGWRLPQELGECLDSIAGSHDAPSHEVIVVLNGADPSTIQVAETHPAVTKIVRRQENIGFGAGMNLGAAEAEGRLLIFLNDDTTVDPSWMLRLVESADKHPEAGAVASVILNFDGTVQEAGCRVLSFGATVPLGSGLSLADAEAAGFLAPRPIDYGSAAALLVRRELFHTIGGFDEVYGPAYFEDVDLEFRIRELGHAVRLEPSAKVLHHSGRSTSNDHWFRLFASATARRQFIKRWGHALAGAPDADDPLSSLCPIPRDDSRPHPDNHSTRDETGLEVALKISRAYQDWLREQLEQQVAQPEVAVDPRGPSRREMINLIGMLRMRVDDLESRRVAGLIRMRVGVWLHSRFRGRSSSQPK